MRKEKNIHKHPQYGHTIRAFQICEPDTLDCLRKQPCLALLTSAASFLPRTTMKPRVASCNLTQRCWMVERKCVTQGEIELIQRHSAAPLLEWHTEPALTSLLNQLCHSSSLRSHPLPLLSLLSCHFLILPGCTPDSPGLYTYKRLVMQHPSVHTDTTLTIHVLLRKNIYPFVLSLHSNPPKNHNP